jgi:hypothetical protein
LLQFSGIWDNAARETANANLDELNLFTSIYPLLWITTDERREEGGNDTQKNVRRIQNEMNHYIKSTRIDTRRQCCTNL